MPDPIANEITLTVTGTLDGFMPLDVSAVVTMVPETAPEPPDPGPDPAPGDLSVCIDYGGAQMWFHADGATDRGDWTDQRGGFVQNRLDVTNAELPEFLVQFRCDREGGRTEVVFELGDTTAGTTAYNMTAYTATIYSGEEVLAVREIPEHYWYSRWRWQSSPRPIVASIEELQAAGLLPYFDTALATTRPLSPTRVYEPMGLAGLTAYVPSTGERDEIGLVTEAQAEYLRGDASADSLLAQAEASGTFPWHYRDEQGGGIFDFVTHPQAQVYYPANIPVCSTPITLDCAHEPPLAYLPFLLTDDPYFLEELQFAATYNVLCSNPASRGNFNIGHALRAHAWSLRVLAQCATVTPETTPSWIKTRAYWKDWFDQERDWMLTRYVNPTAPPFTELPYADFHFMVDATGSPATSTLPGGTYNSVWMEDFEAAVLGHVVMLGHEDWRPILEWKMVNTIARTNGTSGWIRAKTTLYTMALRETDKSPYAADWSAVWGLNVQMQPGMEDFADPDAIPPDASLTYASYTMSALALAASLGVEGAADCYTWLRGQLAANSDSNTYSDRKWSFASSRT